MSGMKQGPQPPFAMSQYPKDEEGAVNRNPGDLKLEQIADGDPDTASDETAGQGINQPDDETDC